MQLIVAEKPSVAKDIAAALGASYVSSKNAYENPQYRVIHLHGHVLSLQGLRDSDERFQTAWNQDTLALLPVWPDLSRKAMYVPQPRTKDLLTNAVKHMNDSGITRVINACDAEREGELLFWEVYHYADCKKPVVRFWESEYPSKEVVERGLSNLRDESFYGPRKRAAYARQQADWLVGMNLTVGYIAATGQKLTVGPVQTPTLALIVNRDYLNDNIPAIPYYEVQVSFDTFTARLKVTPPRFEDKPYSLNEADAQMYLEELLKFSFGTVKAIDKSTAKVATPQLFSLTALQRVASRKYSFSPSKTLELAQKLYEVKVLSYPRTDSQVIGDTMIQKVEAIAKELGKAYGIEYGELRLSKRNVNNAELTDHHAIIPLRPLAADASADEKKLYELVLHRFFEAFGPEAIDQTVKVTLSVGPYTCEATGRTVVDPGWRAFSLQTDTKAKATDDEDESEAETPALFKLTQNQTLKYAEAPEILRKSITPPPRFTYDKLLAAMQNLASLIDDDKELREETKAVDGQLGTPATRAALIDMLIQRGYIEQKKKQLVSTALGKTIIGLVAEDLKAYKKRAQMEVLLNRFDDPKAIDQYMQDIRAMIEANIAFCKSLTPSSIQYPTLDANCPNCQSPIADRGKFYKCSSCDFSLPKTYAGRTLTERDIKDLITHGYTGILTFKSTKQKGQTYQAKITLQDGALKLAYPTTEDLALGKCPSCQAGHIVPSGKVVKCTHCDYKLWRTVYGKELTDKQLTKLLKDKKLPEVKGLQYQERTFSAPLVLVGDKIRAEKKGGS